LLLNQRLARTWTQREMAEACGLSERLVRSAESGGPIERKSVDAIARVLSLPVEAIILADSESVPESSMAPQAKRFLEQIWNHGNMEVIEELLLPEFRFHHERGVVSNREQMRQRIVEFRRSFSDFDFVVEDAKDYGPFVVSHWRVAMTQSGTWLSLPATNRRATVYGSSWVQVINGKFGDAWDFWDPQSLYKELAAASQP
jgi:transcriptional regulator with XRE-family HTH domain